MPLIALLLATFALSSPQDAPADSNDRLHAALDEVDRAGLRADLEFLAADVLGGRDTPSEGLAVAALYLRARLQRLGFAPPDGTSWFAPFPLEDRSLDVTRSQLRATSAEGPVDFVFGEDYYFSRTSHVRTSEAKGRAVSVGAGSRDEFESADLGGAWAILFDQGISTRRASRYAEKGGAVGVVIIEDPEVSKPFAERYRSQTRIARTSSLSYRGQERQRTNVELPLVLLDADAGARLLALAGLAEAPAAGAELGIELHEQRALRKEGVQVNNVAGLWPGNDPDLRHEVLVISAHYDHVGMRGEEIYNGADDNASGTAGLLGVAEALAAYGPLRRSVLLLWVSGEEKGLWGSHAWASAPVLPEGYVPVADVNIDMIGRTGDGELYVTPSRVHESYNALSRAAYELSSLEGFPVLESQDRDWARSDHFNFDKILEIPVVFLSAGEHPDYHQPSDTAEKIDFAKLERITRLVVRLLDAVQALPLERAGG